MPMSTRPGHMPADNECEICRLVVFLYCCCLQVRGPLKAGPAPTPARGQKWGISGLHTRLVMAG